MHARGPAARREPALAGPLLPAAPELLGSRTALVDEEDADWVLRVRGEADGLRGGARHFRAAR